MARAPARGAGGAVRHDFATLNPGCPGFNHDLDWLTLPKDAPLVKSALFIDWRPVPVAFQPASGPAVTAPRAVITAAVSLGARIRDAAADKVAWRNASVLTTRLTTASLNKHNHAMTSYGAFQTTYTDWEMYVNDLAKLIILQADLSELELTMADLEEPTPFDTPAAAAARAAAPAGGRAAGRAGRRGAAPPPPPPPAPPAVPIPGPVELAWLTMAYCADLIDPLENLPFLRLARTWLLMADRCVDAQRRDPRSLVRLNSEVMRSGVAKAVRVDKPSDALLGRDLNEFCKVTILFPLPLFRSNELTLATASTELADAMAYAQGDRADGSRAVARRLLYAEREYPELCTLLQELGSPEERVVQLERLATMACPGRHAQALHLRLSDLNTFIIDRAPLITQARNKGKAGSAIVDLVLTDARETGSSAVVDAAHPHRDDDGGIGGMAAGLSALALTDALQDDKFVQAAALIGAEDTGTSAGRRKVLDIATGAGCMIFQKTFATPGALKGRHEALGKVHDSAAELGTYIGQRQAMDSSGNVNPLAEEWVLHQSQVDLLCKAKVSKMDLINPPHGVIGLMNLTASEPFEPVPEDQLYITEAVLDALGPFGHKMLVAWGGPSLASSTTGYTFLTLCQAQRNYIEWIHTQGDAVQKDLLPHADAIFRAALERVDVELMLALGASNVKLARFKHLLCFGESFDNAIASKKAGVAPLITLHRALPGLVHKSTPRSLPGVQLASGRGRGGGLDGGGDERPPKKQKPASKDPVKPGSKRDVAVWVDDSRLRLGLDTFDIAGYAKQLGLSEEESGALCWPVLVSRQPKAAAIAFCHNPGHKDHQGANAVAHRSPPGFDFTKLCNDFCTRDKRPGGGGGAARKKQKKN